MSLSTLHTISGNSPATASVAAVSNPLYGLVKYDWLIVDVTIKGSTNGSVDAWLERKIEGLDQWREWIRFPQVAAGATKYYTVQPQATNTIYETSQVTAASPASPTLSANVAIGGHPGDVIRLVCEGGAGTDSAAAQVVYVTGWQTR